MTTAPTIFTLSLSESDVDLIGEALGKLPLEKSMVLWLNLKAQISTQQAKILAAASIPAPQAPEPVAELAQPVDETPDRPEENGDDSTNISAG